MPRRFPHESSRLSLEPRSRSIARRSPPGRLPKKQRKGIPPTKRRTKPQILLVHGSPLTRLGLQMLLRKDGRFVVCGQADGASAARDLFAQYQPELVVTGLTLHDGDGIALIKDFRKLAPGSRTMVLSKRDDAVAVQRAFRAGARAYLTTSDDPDLILRGLDQILLGELYASERVGRRLLEIFTGRVTKTDDSKIASLSDRELQVFSLFGRGFGPTRLAAELHLSVKTVETHQRRIKEKMGLRSAAELSKEASLWMSAVARRQLAAPR